MDKQNEWYTYNAALVRLTKERNSDIFYNMDKPWRHYAQWNKSDTRGQIVWFYLYEIPRVFKFTESRIAVARVRGMENGGLLILFNVYRVQFEKMAKTVEVCGDDGWTAVWMCLVPLSCTLKNIICNLPHKKTFKKIYLVVKNDTR